jgi:hypothetical protein
MTNSNEFSPLSQPKPRSLDDLFEADPESLSDADIDEMVARLRAERSHFKLAKATKAKGPAKIPTGTVDELLGMLGLKKEPSA